MKTIFLPVLMFISLQVQSQNMALFKWPENEITPIFKEFVTAFNNDEIVNFTKKHYAKDHEKNANYWRGVFSEYGQITPYQFAKDWTKKNRLAIWFQGVHTKDWVMIILKMDKQNIKIIGKTVVRGLRPKQVASQVLIKNIKPYLKGYLNKLSNQNRFSGTVLVAKGNTILFNNTYGKSNLKNNRKNTAKTSFNIASTTKVFTSVAITQLVERGKLKFTDQISKFIPEYPKDIANQVTIHHLLTHTSGIEIDDYPPFNNDVSDAISMNDLLRAQIKHIDSMNNNRRANFKVLNTYDYSNENYALLGVIIERVTNKTYANYLEENIFKPLKMKSSYANISKTFNNKNVAFGYTNRNEKGEFVDGIWKKSSKMIPNFIDPFGGVYSNSRDLYTFFKAINTNKIVTKKSQEFLQKKHVKIFEWQGEKNYYGYGFNIIEKDSDTSIGHSGVVNGNGSRFEYYPKSDIYVIVLSNYSSMAGNIIANHLRDIISLKQTP
jgi:CubicO group peptidase (beta-lactamase class C family)